MKVLFLPFGWFMQNPILALVPAALFIFFFGYLYLSHRPRWAQWTMILTASLWMGYAGWESFMFSAYPPRSGPIRVDLLLIAPILWMVTLPALCVVFLCRSRQPVQ